MNRETPAPLADPETIEGRPRPTYQMVLDRDTNPPSPCLRDVAPYHPQTVRVPTARYTSPDYFLREVREMWEKVWHMACRDEDIPAPGDQTVYDIADRSVLLVRTESGTVRGFVNSCPHRGRKLRADAGQAQTIRCAFHGWTWNLDGSVKSIPCRWDFPHLTDDDAHLREVQVGTWGGFVFINFDTDAAPLADYLGVLPEHFAPWRLEDCYKSVHLAGVMQCNWKVAQEAFMESYHVIATHPQILPFFADASAQYDLYGDNVNRNLAAFGVTSPHMGEGAVSEQEIVAQMLGMREEAQTVDPKDDGAIQARRTLGDKTRAAFSRAYGTDHSGVSDAEVLDALVYNVFPNFAPWGGFAPNIVYRWRPNGMDVHSCIMEVMILKRCPAGKPRPAPAELRWIEPGAPWSEAPELPVLGPVIDQDISNLGLVQDGLRNSATGVVELARYEEQRIRHFHQTLGKYVAD